MRRREFIAGLAGAAAVGPSIVRAQQPAQMRRLGVLEGIAEDDSEAAANLAAFRQQLEQLGWTEGRNLRSDIRFGAGDAVRIRKYSAELISATPDIAGHRP